MSHCSDVMDACVEFHLLFLGVCFIAFDLANTNINSVCRRLRQWTYEIPIAFMGDARSVAR